MITARHLKTAFHIGVLPVFNVLDPCPVNAERNFVFGFACCCTGMATDALPVVDYESIIHRDVPEAGQGGMQSGHSPGPLREFQDQ